MLVGILASSALCAMGAIWCWYPVRRHPFGLNVSVLFTGCTCACLDEWLASSVQGHVILYRCDACNATRRIPAPPTLTESTAAGQSVPDASTPMDVDAPEPAKSRKRKRKSAPVARPPPLFARDGHVVLCGNDTLPSGDPHCGDGIYIT
jgi:hypothetical protein